MLMYADVVFPLAAPGAYTYRICEEHRGHVQIGSRVRAELGKKSRFGFVIRVKETNTLPTNANLKELLELSPTTPFFYPAYMKFMAWLADYYMAQPGEVFRTALPAPLLRYLEKHPADLDKTLEPGQSAYPPETLNPEQTEAFKKILVTLRSGKHQTFLLQGVTGSGKSHIYYALAKETLAAGKRVLIMVPEISLTPQTVKRFTDIFKETVAVLHSGLTDKERIRNWLRIHRGEAAVVVGVRSVIFTPIRSLGLIVVDEEHDSSFCEGDRSFSFNARDAAVVRGNLENAIVVLGSATPSIVSRHNVDTGKYIHLTLIKRYQEMPMPKVHKVDMREERKAGNRTLFSRLLRQKMAEQLRAGKQIILLKNRRGYAHFLQCPDCGNIPACSHCNVSLSYHRNIGRLVCHYCNARAEVPLSCPKCKGKNLRPAGSGAERVEEELQKIYPHARTLRLDLDTGSKRGAVEKILQDFRDHKADVLIGTQMVSKGLDFPDVTLVGIVLADTGLYMPDFHASERTFQLLTQVAGRSGRGTLPGEVVLQTCSPEEKAVAFAVGHDYEAFYRAELGERKELGFPPFGRGVLVRFLSKKEPEAQMLSEKFHSELEEKNAYEILGPSPMPLYRLRTFYRTFVYLRGASSNLLHNCVAQALLRIKPLFKSSARIQVVFDPDSLL